jgi:hypothetical protein
MISLSVCSATKQIPLKVAGLMPSKSPALGVITRAFVLACLLLLALAYPASRFGVFEWPRAYDPLALPDMRETPALLTSFQMKLVDASWENCAAAFALAQQPIVLLPPKPGPPNCQREGTVMLTGLSTAKLKPEETRCSIAARLFMWERHGLAPAARAHLGTTVAEILHFGSYSCRTIAGRAAMSEHANANAFDIAGFRLADGRVVTLQKHWRGAGPEAAFLREARDGLCSWFNATLSPDYNAAHKDHFHVDMGWWHTCR